MKSFTIHKLDSQLATMLEKRAKMHGKSINQTVKKLLAESLGLIPSKPTDHRDEFMDQFATWSSEDTEVFEKKVETFNQIDEEEW